jgi:hypothetical protein
MSRVQDLVLITQPAQTDAISEAPIRSKVVVLEIKSREARIAPNKVVSLSIRLDKPQLGDPVDAIG